MQRSFSAGEELYNGTLLAGTAFDTSAAGSQSTNSRGAGKHRKHPSSAPEPVKQDPPAATQSLREEGANARLVEQAGLALRRDEAADPALPQPLREALTAWPSPELETQLASLDFGAMAAGLKPVGLALESQLFSKLLYRHKNQHRHTLSFRHLLEVQRGMRLLMKLRLADVVSEFGALFRTRHAPHRESTVACGEAGVHCLRTLLAGCRLAESSVGAIRRAASLTSTHLARLHFVRLHMLVLAMLGRLQVLLCSLLLQAVRCYNELVSLAGLLPFREAKTEHTGSELPEMLRCDWKECVPVATTLPFPDDDGILQRSQQHGLTFQLPRPPASLQDRARLEAEAAIAAAGALPSVPQKRERQTAPQKPSKQQKRSRLQGKDGSAGSSGLSKAVERREEPQSSVPSAHHEAAERRKALSVESPNHPEQPSEKPQSSLGEASAKAKDLEPAAQPSALAGSSGQLQPEDSRKPNVQRAGRGFASMPLIGVAKRPGLSSIRSSAPLAASSAAVQAASLGLASSQPTAASSAAAWDPKTGVGTVTAQQSLSGSRSNAGGPNSGAAADVGRDQCLPPGAAARSARQSIQSPSGGSEQKAEAKSLPLLPAAGKKRKKSIKLKSKEAAPEQLEPLPPSWQDLNPW